MTFKSINKKWTSTTLIGSNTQKKKTQSIRPVAKAQVLTSVEQRKILREKVEQKRVEEEHKKK